MKDGLKLTERELASIENAITIVYEAGYKDKMVTLIEAMAALSTIDTIIELAESRQQAAMVIYERESKEKKAE